MISSLQSNGIIFNERNLGQSVDFVAVQWNGLVDFNSEPVRNNPLLTDYFTLSNKMHNNISVLAFTLSRANTVQILAITDHWKKTHFESKHLMMWLFCEAVDIVFKELGIHYSIIVEDIYRWGDELFNLYTGPFMDAYNYPVSS